MPSMRTIIIGVITTVAAGGAGLTIASGGGGSCTTPVTTLTALTTAANAAAGGATIWVNSSSYLGTWSGVAKTSPGITIKACSGQTPKMTVNFGHATTAAWLTLDGIKIGGGESVICGPAHNLTFKNAESSFEITIYGGGPMGFGDCPSDPVLNNAAILFDNMDFTINDDFPYGKTMPHEGRVEIYSDGTGSTAMGVTFDHSIFENGCADGIQANTGGFTVQNSIFRHLRQDSCDPADPDPHHVDSIQFFRGGDGFGQNTVINGDYFYDDQDGLASYTDSTTGVAISNSAFQNIPPNSPDVCAAICLMGGVGISVKHVVLTNAGMDNGANNSGHAMTGTILQDSIMQVEPDSRNGSLGTYTTKDHNWCTVGTCAGTGSLNGAPAPSWVGGTTPTTFAGFALTGGSRGTGVASDSTNIGVNP